MMRQLLFGAFGAALLLSGEAEAQRVYTPGFGLGGGVFVLDGEIAPALQIDFGVGIESDLNPAPGMMFRLDFLAGQTGDELDIVRLDLAPMVTTSFGHDGFARVGAGPLFSFTGVSREGSFGVGAQGELALGVKDIVELYGDGRVSFDPELPSVGVTAGLRINSFVWARFVLEVLDAVLQ